mmetsp:Transcript_76419/g.247925  ORF Transcript_76419/g.247925 Transcript_76419/m.247925 type:complete len:156 (+) Transcript_76419:230-697(+)
MTTLMVITLHRMFLQCGHEECPEEAPAFVRRVRAENTMYMYILSVMGAMGISIMMMSSGTLGTGLGPAPRSAANPYMVAEPVVPGPCARPVRWSDVYRKEDQEDERWTEGDCQSKLKIENLGPRRARSGRSRCLEDLRKFLECWRSSEAPSAAQR